MKSTDIKKQVINTINHHTNEDRKYINDRTLKVTNKFQKILILKKVINKAMNIGITSVMLLNMHICRHI